VCEKYYNFQKDIENFMYYSKLCSYFFR